MAGIVVSELREISVFDGLPEQELHWLAANGREAHLANGDYFIKENEPGDLYYVVLDGELQVSRTLNGQEVVMGTTPRGIMGGELSLLNGAPSLVTAQAIMPSRLLVLDLHTFRQSFTSCPVFSTRIFQVAAERAHGYATYVKQQEKMAALGKLSAGLAHELNNPAAAARRAAKTLREALPSLLSHTLRLNSLKLRAEQLDTLMAFQQRVVGQTETAVPLPPLEQSDREDELGNWLEEHGMTNGWEMAASFVAAGVVPADLEELAGQLPHDCITGTLAWLHEILSITDLLKEVEQSTHRISDLVGAIKSYTYMDQGPVQEVDIHKGLENTLLMMKHKFKNITLIRQYDPKLPTIIGRGSELNQVWTNLIDNAIDATSGEGTLRLITRYENNFVMVEVADDGPGIPPEVQSHLFEPFFTTKDIGVGTGLGLDISYRIVRQHQGTIEVWSQPGETRFIVRLPINRGEYEGGG